MQYCDHLQQLAAAHTHIHTHHSCLGNVGSAMIGQEMSIHVVQNRKCLSSSKSVTCQACHDSRHNTLLRGEKGGGGGGVVMRHT